MSRTFSTPDIDEKEQLECKSNRNCPRRYKCINGKCIHKKKLRAHFHDDREPIDGDFYSLADVFEIIYDGYLFLTTSAKYIIAQKIAKRGYIPVYVEDELKYYSKLIARECQQLKNDKLDIFCKLAKDYCANIDNYVKKPQRRVQDYDHDYIEIIELYHLLVEWFKTFPEVYIKNDLISNIFLFEEISYSILNNVESGIRCYYQE
jgi:hypothetical protein